jgi:uncharacterized membrane-anchored protein
MRRTSGIVLVALTMMFATVTAGAKPATDAKKSEGAAKAAPAPEPAHHEDIPDNADGSTPATTEEIEASLPPHVNGPKLVDLGHNIEVDLPAGMLLLDRKEAQEMLRATGGQGDDVLAIVGKVDADWMVVIEYSDVGYVSDSDADKLDANELFQQYQEGTRQQNERRKALGVPELVLDGWSEMPAYKKVQHQLVWGLKGHTTEGPVINFFTRLLGRHGYLSVNLIDKPESIEQSKIDAGAVLTGVRYQTGFRYTDHAEGDKSSGMGLRALVIGGTGLAVAKAAKAGILIKLLLVFKKAFWAIGLAIVGLFKWLTGRKSKDEAVASVPPSDETPPTDSQG